MNKNLIIKLLVGILAVAAVAAITITIINIAGNHQGETSETTDAPVDNRTYDEFYGSYTNAAGDVLIISQYDGDTIYLENGTTSEGQTIIDWSKTLPDTKFKIDKSRTDDANGCIIIYDAADYTEERLSTVQREYLCKAGTSYTVSDNANHSTTDLSSFDKNFIVTQNGDTVDISTVFFQDARPENAQ